MIYKVDFLATEKHFFDHSVPIFKKLPEDYRGTFFVGSAIYGHAKRHLNEKYLKTTTKYPLESSREYVLVNAVGDLRKAGPKHVIYMEHGVGLSYGNLNPSYCDSSGSRKHVKMFLCPNSYVFERVNRNFPTIAKKMVGIPYMDKYANRIFKVNKKNPTIVISFHWDCKGNNNFTRSAYNHYRNFIPKLKKEFPRLMGHGHPRILAELDVATYKPFDIPVIRNFSDVVEKADLYMVDNSSTLFEFAFTNKPVVVMNCPYYNKKMKVNYRFWEYADIGVNVEPTHLQGIIDGIYEALEDSEEQQFKRKKAVEATFTFLDGKCTDRAVDALKKLLTFR